MIIMNVYIVCLEKYFLHGTLQHYYSLFEKLFVISELDSPEFFYELKKNPHFNF